MNQNLRLKGLFLYSIMCLLLSANSFSQNKKKIDHTVYNSWNSVSSVQQSNSGDWVSYEINPYEGDGNLYLTSISNGIPKTFKRGTKAKISYSETYFVYLIQPEFDSLRQLKLDKVKKENLPKDSLAIYWMEIDSLYIIPRVKSFKMAEEGNWMAYLSEDDNRPPCPEKKHKKCKKKKTHDLAKTTGTTLTILNPVTGVRFTIEKVVDYEFSREGNHIAITTSNKGEKDSLSLDVYNLKGWPEITQEIIDPQNHPKVKLLENQLGITNVSFDFNGEQLICLSTTDTNKAKTYELFYWKSGQDKMNSIINTSTPGLPDGHTVSEFGRPYFSKDGSKIFVGTNEIVEQELEDTLLETEKAKVDVWSWNDPRVQPEQLNALKKDKRNSFLGVYHVSSAKFIQLEDETMPNLRILNNGDVDYAMGISDVPYKKQRTWEYPWKYNVYYVSLNDGKRKLINEGVYYSGSFSPSGDYYVYYSPSDSNWYSKELATDKITILTDGLDDVFYSDNNGQPTVTYAEGSGGWIEINNSEYRVVYSKYDIWALPMSIAKKPICITNNQGAKNKYEYRIHRLENDSLYILPENILIHGKDDLTKDEAYFTLDLAESAFSMKKLIESNHKYVYVSRSKKSSHILFRRMNFQDYPDLFSCDKDFSNIQRLTVANPQQSEYNWGTVEFESWKTYSGLDLRGLLYKPEDFDSTKSYPMIIYYYEKYTDNFHYHYVPKPTASIIYPTEYVSNGYIVFIPDIEYTPGHPAKSAYDCIMSATDHLLAKYSWIDSTRMGLQGQSWGGYQTAQLITMTDRYAAAMAGAPVSNMFSAYGGIRWGSGLSRMFQYEQTQSRIGHTIWERPDLYIENSPIFGLPNVNTPLLIMHNDGDGAVPWYQGIELYMGMRRLGKTAWLLNYNGDEHNLMKTANRRDLSIRMRQFFDYYLLEEPMPLWMKDGVPATQKGVDYGLELENSDQ